MDRIKYGLRYLPLFYSNLEEKIIYIAEKLMNPQAANELIDVVERAILDRQLNAESFEPFYSLKQREHPYYRIYVQNYVVYYVVIEDGGDKVMEIRRFLYRRQNRDEWIQ